MIHGLSVVPCFPKTKRETQSWCVSEQTAPLWNCGEVLGGAGDRTSLGRPAPLSTSDSVHLGTKLTQPSRQVALSGKEGSVCTRGPVRDTLNWPQGFLREGERRAGAWAGTSEKTLGLKARVSLFKRRYFPEEEERGGEGEGDEEEEGEGNQPCLTVRKLSLTVLKS